MTEAFIPEAQPVDEAGNVIPSPPDVETYEVGPSDPVPTEPETTERKLEVVPNGDSSFSLHVDGVLFDEGEGTILTRNSVVEVVHDAKILFGPEAVVDESAALS